MNVSTSCRYHFLEYKWAIIAFYLVFLFCPAFPKYISWQSRTAPFPDWKPEPSFSFLFPASPVFILSFYFIFSAALPEKRSFAAGCFFPL